MALTESELRQKISHYQSLKEFELAEKYQKELDSLLARSTNASTGDIVLNISNEDYETAASKFVAPGLHKAEFGMPYWKNPGVSLAFPFTICAGQDAGKEGVVFCGIKKEAAWKIKEILSALGVPKKDINGLVAFNPGDVAGKVGTVLYHQVRDTRSPEEGGTGTVYTKLMDGSCVFPADATLEKIGMSLKSLLLRD